MVHCVLKRGSSSSSPKWIRSSRALLGHLSFAYQGLQSHKSLCTFPFEPIPDSPVNSPKRNRRGLRRRYAYSAHQWRRLACIGLYHKWGCLTFQTDSRKPKPSSGIERQGWTEEKSKVAASANGGHVALGTGCLKLLCCGRLF